MAHRGGARGCPCCGQTAFYNMIHEQEVGETLVVEFRCRMCDFRWRVLRWRVLRWGNYSNRSKLEIL